MTYFCLTLDVFGDCIVSCDGILSSGKITAKIGVDYSIPLPWPQDHPPNEKFLQDITNKEHRVLKRGQEIYENRVIKWSGEFWIELGGNL